MTDNPPPPHSLLARVVWRHRWELIPVWAGLGALIFATLAHSVARNAWPLALAVGAAATVGWRWRAGEKRAQAYAVAVGATATLWFTAAWWASPWHTSLIVILVLGVLVVGIPRWRRRGRPRDTVAVAPNGRAIVPNLRELTEEWPARSAAAELVGSSIQHSQADDHGYTLTLALRPGQTIADVVSSLPRLESALKAPPG